MEYKLRAQLRLVVALTTLASVPAVLHAQTMAPVENEPASAAIETAQNQAPAPTVQAAAPVDTSSTTQATALPDAPSTIQLTPAFELAQAPVAPATESKSAQPAAEQKPVVSAPKAVAAERWLLHIEVPELAIFDKPDSAALVVGRLEQGVDVEADQKSGDWYRIKRISGDEGWVLNAATATGVSMAVRPFPADQRIAYEQAAGDPRIAESLTSEKQAERKTAEDSKADEINRLRPAGAPIEPRLPTLDPKRVAPSSPLIKGEDLPIRDRWRLVKQLGLLPYNPLDPYNPNVLKGDLPVLEKELGKDWFFNFGAVSDTLFDARRLPVPVGGNSTQNPGSNNMFGNGRATTFAETAIFSFGLIKGNTTFKPPRIRIPLRAGV